MLKADHVCAYARQLLWSLPRPLIGPGTSVKLATAAQECLRRPQLKDVGLYIAATAVKDLDEASGMLLSSDAASSHPYPLYMLLGRIVGALHNLASRAQVCIHISGIHAQACGIASSCTCLAIINI
jgi:hypothetical protein